MRSLWFRTALLNLFLAACIGALLRYAFVNEVSWLKFRAWMHGHSHVAMLGWVYLAFFALLIGKFLTPLQQEAKIYRQLFLLTQLSVVGMLIFFPIEGYGLFSITFSTLHVILSYVFAGRFMRDLKEQRGKRSQAFLFVATALIFLLISTLGLWAMGPIMAGEWKRSVLYYMSVQFFLHFQFNGWFLFAVFGLLFRELEERGIALPARPMRWFYLLLVVSCFLTYALAVAWTEPLPIVFWVNSVGVIVQLAATIAFVLVVREKWPEIRQVFKGWVMLLLKVAFFCFLAKILMQTSVAVPHIATIAYTVRNFVIGFIHLMLLGVITTALLGFALEQGLLSENSRRLRIGLIIFLAGFALTEGMLFLQGAMLWAAMGFLPLYYEILFTMTLMLPVGAGLTAFSGRIKTEGV
jgi:hypothetical protein